MAALGAVVIVAGLALLTTAVLGAIDDDDQRQATGFGVLDRGRTTTSDRTSGTRRTTTTTAAPEVLAESTERGPEATTTTAATATSTTVSIGPSLPPPTAPAPTSPPTTTCRDSADPACGPLVWDPAPEPGEVEVVEVSVPRSSIVVGEEVTFSVAYVEQAGGDAVGSCAAWAVRTDPGVANVSSCDEVNVECRRHGPHTPPPPSDDRLEVARTIVFTTPGVHEVTVGGHTATHLPDGCANPYLTTWSRSYVVEVEPA